MSREFVWRLIRPVDAELDQVGERIFLRIVREDAERIARDSAVMVRAIDGIGQRIVFLKIRECRFEIAVFLFEVLQRAAPKHAFFGAAPAKRKNNGERNFPFVEIVADGLAELRLLC